jgi:hypothetical protein
MVGYGPFNPLRELPLSESHEDNVKNPGIFAFDSEAEEKQANR